MPYTGIVRFGRWQICLSRHRICLSVDRNEIEVAVVTVLYASVAVIDSRSIGVSASVVDKCLP